MTACSSVSIKTEPPKPPIEDDLLGQLDCLLKTLGNLRACDVGYQFGYQVIRAAIKRRMSP